MPPSKPDKQALKNEVLDYLGIDRGTKKKIDDVVLHLIKAKILLPNKHVSEIIADLELGSVLFLNDKYLRTKPPASIVAGDRNDNGSLHVRIFSLLCF